MHTDQGSDLISSFDLQSWQMRLLIKESFVCSHPDQRPGLFSARALVNRLPPDRPRREPMGAPPAKRKRVFIPGKARAVDFK
jgi:hypothetical protein